jgi:hypothetical protein
VPAEGIRAGVADQRFERLPIAGRMAARALDEAEQPGRAPGVQPGKRPAGAGVFQLDVIGAHQIDRGDIDQPVPQHIRAQQHLAVAALEATKINLVLGQHNPIRGVLADESAAYEHPTPTNPRHDPGH